MTIHLKNVQNTVAPANLSPGFLSVEQIFSQGRLESCDYPICHAECDASSNAIEYAAKQKNNGEPTLVSFDVFSV